MEYHYYFNKFNEFKNQINTFFTQKIENQMFKTFKSNISNDIKTKSITFCNDIIFQNLKNTALFTLSFILIDKILTKMVNKPYYLLHSIANWGIVYYTYPIVRDTYLNLSNTFNLSNNPISYQICSALHIYHIIRYKMNKEDIKHHIPTLLVLSIPLFNISQSPLVSHIAFFLCGLPGAIDYILLFLSRNNIIHRLTEKKWNVYLNLYVRCPGSILNSAIAFQLVQQKPNMSNFYKLCYFGVASFSFWNGTYYLRNVIADYHLRINNLNSNN
tara:strand:+ start:1537 stop:2352 length:816 start_codon:yes stop_codon:yes gene_type:complete